jgi:hypothetical protein
LLHIIRGKSYDYINSFKFREVKTLDEATRFEIKEAIDIAKYWGARGWFIIEPKYLNKKNQAQAEPVWSWDSSIKRM